jgi:hypothetical protein
VILGGTTLAACPAAFLAPLAAEDGSVNWAKILLLLAVFVGPAIFKSIQESAAKRKLAEERRLGRRETPTVEDSQGDVEFSSATQDEESAEEEEPAGEVSGREAWESLLRGEIAEPEPQAPPPIPVATMLVRQRMSENDTLSREQSVLTRTRALTDIRTPEVAQPAHSLEAPSPHGRPVIQPGRLVADFAEFRPQEAMMSEREGHGPDRIGHVASFSGGAAFKSLGTRGPAGHKLKQEIGGALVTQSATTQRSARGNWSRARLERAVIAAEMFGAPLALRRQDAGPTSPLGLS